MSETECLRNTAVYQLAFRRSSRGCILDVRDDVAGVSEK